MYSAVGQLLLRTVTVSATAAHAVIQHIAVAGHKVDDEDEETDGRPADSWLYGH